MSRQETNMCEVLHDMCEGETEAFDRFYARYAPLVMQVALRMLGERMEAEDVCHDVFLEVLRRGRHYDPSRGSLEAWLSVMTRSRCLDRLRKKKRVVQRDEPLEETAVSHDGSSEEMALLRLQKEALNEALQMLPDRQREAVAYSYYSAHTQQEMSAAWNVPLGTVKSWVRYGIHNMRKHMERQGWMEERKDAAKEGPR
ncbi:RNA polymerase sigma factor [Paenibacillus protaetiae]|uniref:RNA polymerase sigma factor n=1 Tax=Paenibacillus protaetiae TaxID=2509456 RepID=UPI001FC90E07|nr:sigma-70 family RNA polymerase sigma factor [Paenibacillus protaetiae]